MASDDKPVLTEAVAAALDALKSDGRKPTVRAIHDKVNEMGGDYALSTVHAHLQLLKAKTPLTPFTPGDKYMPLVKAAADLIKVETETATAAMKGELDIANSDLETLSQNLVSAESSLAEARAAIADRDLVISNLRAELKLSGEALGATRTELERARNDLARISFREEDYQKALAAASEARERAAMLAGRIEGMESQLKIQLTSFPGQETPVVEKKKSTSKK